MPRKCCTMWNGEPCRTNDDQTKNFDAEKGTVYRFPKPPEQDGWVRSLPNILPSNQYDDKGELSRTLGVCAKHWPLNCENKPIQGGTSQPIEPPSVFGNKDRLCFAQSLLTADRSVEVRTFSAESMAARENLGDKILSWN